MSRKKDRKQTTQGRDGRTARRHQPGRRPLLGVCLFLSLLAYLSWASSQSLADSRSDTFMPPRDRPALVVLSPAASSSDSSLSLASFCERRRRRLPIPCSRGFSRLSANSALLAAYFGPSSLSSSPRARTTLLTPTPIICRQVLVSNTCTSTHSRRHRFVFRSPYVRRGSPSMP